jgi:Aldehyde dehydrogenase family
VEVLMTDDRSGLYIGGQWAVPAGGDRITVRSASTEEIIGSVPEATPADVDAAAGAARRAFDDPSGGATWDPGRRAAILEGLADEYDARAEQVFCSVSAQNGMPISIARQLDEAFPPFCSAITLTSSVRRLPRRPATGCSPAPRPCAGGLSASSPRSCRGMCRSP